MSCSVTKRAAGGSRLEAVGVPGRLASLSPSLGDGAVASEGCWYEVEVRWKSILRDAVADLRGTEPVYSSNNTTDGMFHMNISFLIPSDRSGVHYEEISVPGKRRGSLCEAETEAAVAALKRLSTPIKNIKLSDVSQQRYEEAKIKCQNDLVEAEELHLLLDMLLTNWVDCTHEIEDGYGLVFSKIAKGVNSESKKLRVDACRRLLDITQHARNMYNETCTEAKAAKSEWWKTRAVTRQFFKGSLASTDDTHGSNLSRDIKIRMVTVLTEMMVSLGWEGPKFTTTWCTGNQKCMCEVEFQPKGSRLFPSRGRITVGSGEEASEAEAKEDAAKAAILYLELEMSIFLVDVNYNKRLQIESNLLKAKQSVRLVSSLITKARIQWEQEMGNLSICHSRCRNKLGRHVFKDQNDEEYKAKLECAETVSAVYESCINTFRRGHHRTFDAGTSKKKRKKKE